jgi:hypothetical protein
MVTHSSTSRPVQCLCMAERTEYTVVTHARVAYGLFAVPDMSAECERAFSRVKKMITEKRYRLRGDIIEAEQCS